MPDDSIAFPRIIDTRRTKISQWVTLVENWVANSGLEAPAAFHCLELADYISILAITHDGRVPLVRQFRPAVGRVTLELPGGLHETDDTAEQAVLRELAEETGWQAENAVEFATFLPDTGRLANRVRGFIAHNAAPVPQWRAERNITVQLVAMDAIPQLARQGLLENGPHLAMVGIAMMHGLLRS